MSYGRIIVGLGIALVALLALSSGITLAAQWRAAIQAPPSSWAPQAWGMHGMGWGMMNQEGVKVDSEDHEDSCQDSYPMMKDGFGRGKGKFADFANLTTITGTVKSVNLTRGFIVVTSNGKDYNVYVKTVYVRISDGVLVFGGWILGNVGQGNPITVKGFTKNSDVLAVEITWGGNTYRAPAYYMYLLKSG